MIWDIMLIYKNTHPHVGSAHEYGGTVQILPLSPRLKDVAEKVMPSVMATYNNNYDEVCRRGLGLVCRIFTEINLVVMKNTLFVLLILSISKEI